MSIKKQIGGGLLAVILGFLAVVLMPVWASAQTSTGPVVIGGGGNYVPPIVQVPLDVVLQGRQSVAGWLSAQVDNVYVSFHGSSVSPDHRADKYMDRQMLTDLGYVHNGSFSELSESIKKISFRGKVVKGDYNYYNIYASITCRDISGRTLLQGGGSFNLFTDKNGNLIAKDFPVWLWISGDILAKLPYNVSAASLNGENGSEQYLESYNTESGSLIRLNSNVVGGNNTLKVAYFSKEGDDLLAINLQTGVTVNGIEVIKYFTEVNSGDIRALRNPSTIDAGDAKFYGSNGSIYGRFPLTEIVISEGQSFKDAFIIEVPVWGREKKISPSRMYLTSFVDGKRVEVPVRENGQWFLSLTPGIWHLEIIFEGVKDPELDCCGRG